MADVIGQGVVANAINQGQQLDIQRSQVDIQRKQVDEQERSNKVAEGFTGRQVDLMEKQDTRLDAAEMEKWQQQADKIVGFAAPAMMDLYRQQEEAISEYNLVRKTKKSIYDPKYVTGDYESLINADPDVKDIKDKIEKIQASFDQVQEMVGQFAPILPYSSQGNVTDLFKYELTPWERASMSPEELTEYGRGQVEAIEDVTRRQQAFQNELVASDLARQAQANVDQAVDTKRGVFPFEMALQQARGGGMGEVPPALSAAAIGSRIEVLAKNIDALDLSHDGKFSLGSIDPGFSKLLEDMDPELFYDDAYGPDFNGAGVMNFLDALSRHKKAGNKTKVKEVLDSLPGLQSKLSPGSPFNQVVDFFRSLSGSGWTTQDPIDRLGKVMHNWDVPVFNTTPEKGDTPIQKSLQQQ